MASKEGWVTKELQTTIKDLQVYQNQSFSSFKKKKQKLNTVLKILD